MGDLADRFAADLAKFLSSHGGYIESSQIGSFWSTVPQYGDCSESTLTILRRCRQKDRFCIRQGMFGNYSIELCRADSSEYGKQLPSEAEIVSDLVDHIKHLGGVASTRDVAEFLARKPDHSKVIYAEKRTLRQFCRNHSDVLAFKQATDSPLFRVFLKSTPAASAMAACLAMFVNESGGEISTSEVSAFYGKYSSSFKCIERYGGLAYFCDEHPGMLAYRQHPRGDRITLPRHCCLFLRGKCGFSFSHDGYLHKLPSTWDGPAHCSCGKRCRFGHWSRVEVEAEAVSRNQDENQDNQDKEDEDEEDEVEEDVEPESNKSDISDTSEVEECDSRLLVEPDELSLSVHDIRWAHDSIQIRFQNGKFLVDTLKELLNGSLQAKDLPAFQVWKGDNYWHSITGNRRLWVLKEFCKLTGQSLNISVNQLNPRHSSSWLARMLSTKDGGESIFFRDRSCFHRSMSFAMAYRSSTASSRPSSQDFSIAKVIGHENSSVHVSQLQHKFGKDIGSYVLAKRHLYHQTLNGDVCFAHAVEMEVSASSDPDLAEAELDFPDARDATTCSERGEEGEDDDATSKSEIHQVSQESTGTTSALGDEVESEHLDNENQDPETEEAALQSDHVAEPRQQMADCNLVETPPHDSGEVHQCDRLKHPPQMLTTVESMTPSLASPREGPSLVELANRLLQPNELRSPWDTEWVLDLLPMSWKSDLRELLTNPEVQRLVLKLGEAPQLATMAGWLHGRLISTASSLTNSCLSSEDLELVLEKLGGCERISSCMVPSSLHRFGICWSRSGVDSITFHLAQPLVACSLAFSSVLQNSETTIFLGQSACGKTSILRDAAKRMSEKFQVVVVDYSEDLGGLIPGPSEHLGSARRLVPSLVDQAEVIDRVITEQCPEVVVAEFSTPEVAVAAAYLCCDAGVRLVCSLRTSLQQLVEAFHRRDPCPQLLACMTFPFKSIIILSRYRFDSCQIFSDGPGTACCFSRMRRAPCAKHHRIDCPALSPQLLQR